MPTIDHLLSLAKPFIPMLIGISVITVLLSVIAVPWIIVSLPTDYFTHRHRHRLHRPGSGSPGYWLWLVVKNLLGATLIVLGLIMMLTPGQGLLTVLIGLGVADFPGKYALERRLVAMPGVLRTINWIRRRHNRPPLEELPPISAQMQGRSDTTRK